MICDHQRFKEILRFGATPLYKCDECMIVFTDKCLKGVDPKILYEDYYKNEMAGRFSFSVEFVIRLFRFFRAFKIFTIDPHAKRILDIGSGRGFTLYYLKKYYQYLRTVGIQISKNAFEFSRNKLGLEIYDKDLLELSLEKGSFDIITLWHVLEHLTHPEKYIERIYDLLNKRGKLIIEVPNFNSWSRSLTRRYWLGLDLDYHINFFTPKSLSALLKKYHFHIKLIRTFSLEYSVFISVQSFVSFVSKSDHLFFQFLQTGGFSRRLISHLLLLVMFTPVCFLINAFLYFSKRGEVLFIVAEKY